MINNKINTNNQIEEFEKIKNKILKENNAANLEVILKKEIYDNSKYIINTYSQIKKKNNSNKFLIFNINNFNINYFKLYSLLLYLISIYSFNIFIHFFNISPRLKN